MAHLNVVPEPERLEEPDQTGPEADVTPRRVLLVDDHRTFSDLLAMALSGYPEFLCVGQADRAEKAFELVRELRPDIVIMDLQMPDMDGLAATTHLLAEHPALRVIILTAHSDLAFVAKAAAAGAVGYVPKDGGLDAVLQTLRQAASGTMTVSPRLLAQLDAESGATERVPGDTQPSTPADGPAADLDGPAAAPGSSPLTAREHEVLELMSDGVSARMMAKELGISLHTCRGHVKSVLAKLGAHSQLEAVAVARRANLLAAR